MRADMTFTGGDDRQISAIASFDGATGFVSLMFEQDGNLLTIVVPERMASCVNTIARVFNECMDAKPETIDPEALSAAIAAREHAETSVDRGSYIGLTRDQPPPHRAYKFRTVE